MNDLVAAIAFTALVMGLPLVALWLANVLEDRRRRKLRELTPEQRAIYAQLGDQPK